MLDIVPAGVIVFPGSGITGNLADKAKRIGIPVLDHREGAVTAPLFLAQPLFRPRHKQCLGLVITLLKKTSDHRPIE